MERSTVADALSIIPPLWHHLTPSASHAQGEVYQTSLMSALLDGVYEGTMSYGELMSHGDFGLGTFNDLDGEMVGFDGAFYQLRSDGGAKPVTPDQKTPFAVLAFFRPQLELHITKPSTKQELLAIIEEATDTNLFSAIKISGHFTEVTTRTVGRQIRPFPPLATATANESLNVFADVAGTLAGFRTPSYAQGIGVAGFHMHFLNQEKNRGGHALDYKVLDVTVQISPLTSFHLELPNTGDFLNASLSGEFVDQAIKCSEG